MDEVKENYLKPGHKSAFSGKTKLYKSNEKRIKQKEIEKILSSIDSYTRHREFKKPRLFNPYFVRAKRVQIQCDLIDVQELSRYNDGYKYLVVFLDVFTKKMWIYPVKDKRGKSMADVFTRFLNNDVGKKPEMIFCDRGTELKNRDVKNVLQQKNIEMMHPNSHIKASLVERANKSIQRLIYKYMTQNETFRYIDKLEHLVRTYNVRPHESLEDMSPNEAELPANILRVKLIHERRFNKINKKGKKRYPEPKLKIDDVVRIARLPDRFNRGYQETVTAEFFTITKVNTTMPVPTYEIKSMNTDEKIEGAFYAAELTKCDPETVFKIERVIRSRRRNGRLQHYVKWLHFGPQHNSWVDDEDIVADFRRNNV